MTGEERRNFEERIRGDFPIFSDPTLVYLDNSATTQKPKQVLDAVIDYYETKNANPMRGLYDLSIKATDAYEESREAAARFINAKEPAEIVFTRNASESLNLVAYTYGRAFLTEKDEIIVNVAEHHSNMLPWQQVAKATGATLTYLEPKKDGTLTPDMLEAVISEKTALVAVNQISNVFGRLNDIKGFADVAHRYGAILVADGAQSVPHVPVDVQALDCDFLSFSGHKMLAPMGIGVLYGKRELLEKMPPFLFGGEMIEYVTREGATYAEVPHKFEAGTVNDGGAVGLKAAIEYYEKVGFEAIEEHERHLTRLAFEGMKKIPHVHIIGAEDPDDHHGILTFTLDDVHPHDIAAMFDAEHICVRAGHHCAQPLMQYLGTPATTRASIAFYNREYDIERFLEVLATLRGKMGYGD